MPALGRRRPGTGIVPIYTPTATPLAMTLATFDVLASGQAVLSLGVS
jgi:alkanesulfonate monooxygenase SsuD/methylene tetrahydromethanopterin reductase-like flavin-dependent oxidoreductase (luciferase family)